MAFRRSNLGRRSVGALAATKKSAIIDEILGAVPDRRTREFWARRGNARQIDTNADEARRWERFFAYTNFARQKTASRLPLWFARLAEPYDAA
jgi:hypothetical protein